MLWAQWTLLALMIFGFGISMEQAGKPRKNPNYYGGWMVILITTMNFALIASAGGLDRLIGWPTPPPSPASSTPTPTASP